MPPILFLDEPSAGMDPGARRNMWSIIQRITTTKNDKDKSTVILTTHSMDECEALCNRIMIMTRGVPRCSGTIPHVKSIYGKGFDVYIKLQTPKKRDLVDLLITWEYLEQMQSQTD